MSYRYLGNKSRLKDWIADAIAERVDVGATIADPMCGTASVSRALADRGFKIIASDQLKFPTLHAKARLLHDGSFDFNGFGSYLRCLEFLDGMEPARGFFWREYSDEGSPANGVRPRKYLTGCNAGRVDAIRQRIKDWRADGLEDRAADLLLHDLILSVNRVANIAGTYGYYRSTWDKGSLADIKLVPTPATAKGVEHRVLHGCADEIAAQVRAHAFYIDPPYTKRQYAGNYHIPETLAQEDEPEPAGDGGLRDWSTNASDFCYRRRASTAFKSILDQVRSKWVFISYSEDAHLPSDELTEILQGYGSVELHKQPLERFRSNDRVARSGHVVEHLYILERADAFAAKSGGTVDEEAAAI